MRNALHPNLGNLNSADELHPVADTPESTPQRPSNALGGSHSNSAANAPRCQPAESLADDNSVVGESPLNFNARRS